MPSAAGSVGLVGDVSIVHPFVGQGKQRVWGEYKPGALSARCAEKNRKYYDFHKREGFVFVPLAATTHGVINADAMVLCHVFGYMAAEAFYSQRGWPTHNTKGPLPSFLSYTSHLVTLYKARVGITVCRAAGMRGLIGGAASVFVPPAAARVGDVDFGDDLPSGLAG
jgi:hypothetical protein